MKENEENYNKHKGLLEYFNVIMIMITFIMIFKSQMGTKR
jgi:hypothetical protein